ncbi:hypothetical protein SERLA73DRAFT_68203 [Serpula lacrymans var. lacrymans S7.3]|uniref:Fork-head domain-containing protein n=2 Tax=Serpula lacrymans var. lacrymans TaxID=341189 RepID=F8PHI9_SERL3|nr:uncharacterized protein SERLADRAFT_431937 [Serpula lacrymans var. lacrymans S7.9]EGO04521.1 hypothetical protein SERLA73DRAFT_68203 [Serpula lacrymans var. lacrymans S7.3]EGO30402.1 hypothetical protein SERLADRAFT_431937 [Serpula lacrymans var. lacrymans S7.9]
MSSLQNILNPDINHKRSAKPQSRELPVRGSPSSTPSDISANTTAAFNHSSQIEPLYKQHELHPNCPDTLVCLPDTAGRPQHTLPVILRCAILGSPRKRLTIREIYAAMEGKYTYYKTAGPTWKQSVRHHLSLNRLFERQPRPVTDPGFGSYWTVNLSAPPGTKRPRKRGRPNKIIDDGLSSNTPKKRGRPRKGTYTIHPSPPSHPALPIASPPPCRVSSVRSQGDHVEDVDEDILVAYERNSGTDLSDEYESEEDMVIPPRHRPSISGISTFGMQQSPLPLLNHHFVRGPTSDIPNSEDNLIDRLHIEVAGLRRQSADAISVSLRLSDQLAEAHAECSRAKASLRTAETMLEEEVRKRREAEQIADDEGRMRRAAEDSLKQFQRQRLPGRTG